MFGFIVQLKVMLSQFWKIPVGYLKTYFFYHLSNSSYSGSTVLLYAYCSVRPLHYYDRDRITVVNSYSFSHITAKYFWCIINRLMFPMWMTPNRIPIFKMKPSNNLSRSYDENEYFKYPRLENHSCHISLENYCFYM